MQLLTRTTPAIDTLKLADQVRIPPLQPTRGLMDFSTLFPPEPNGQVTKNRATRGMSEAAPLLGRDTSSPSAVGVSSAFGAACQVY